MKFGLAFGNVGPLVYPDALADFAIAAESVGFESIWTTEHVAVPVEYTSQYPYHESGRVAYGISDMPFPDPLLPLAFIAGVTSTLRLATGILILAQRHPLYVAKELATLDVLSKGRVICGVGVNWMREEYDALGISFDDRGARSAESVEAIRTLWKDQPQAFDGKFFKWPALHSNPKPMQKPGVPFVVGGGSAIAAKRAARYGDGFFPPVTDPEALKTALNVMREECEKLGRRPEDIELTVGDAMADPPEIDGIRQLADLGVSRLIIRPPGKDQESMRAGLHEFADRVIARF